MLFIWLIFVGGLASSWATKKTDYEEAVDKAIKYAKIHDLFKPLDLQEFRDNITISKVLLVPPYKSYVRRIRTAMPGKPVNLRFMFIAKTVEPESIRQLLCTATIHEFNLEGRFYYILPSAKNLKCEEYREDEEEGKPEPPVMALRKQRPTSNAALPAPAQKVPGNAAQATPHQMTSGGEALAAPPKAMNANVAPAVPPIKEPTSTYAAPTKDVPSGAKVVIMKKGTSLVPVVVPKNAVTQNAGSNANHSVSQEVPKSIPVIELGGRNIAPAAKVRNMSSTIAAVQLNPIHPAMASRRLR